MEKTLFMEISSKVQFTMSEVIMPIIDPIMLDRINEKVDEKYFMDFIYKNLIKLKRNLN